MSHEPHKPGDIASFVVRFTQRLWRDEQGDPRVRWRGHIRHVQSDAEARFTDFADALDFIQQRLAQLTMDAVAEDPEPQRAKALTDSLRLWEQFATSYAERVVSTMTRTLEQSAAVGQQVNETLERSLRAWNPLLPQRPGSREAGGDEAVLAAIEALRDEVRALDAKVERLAQRSEARQDG